MPGRNPKAASVPTGRLLFLTVLAASLAATADAQPCADRYRDGTRDCSHHRTQGLLAGEDGVRTFGGSLPSGLKVTIKNTNIGGTRIESYESDKPQEASIRLSADALARRAEQEMMRAEREAKAQRDAEAAARYERTHPTARRK